MDILYGYSSNIYSYIQPFTAPRPSKQGLFLSLKPVPSVLGVSLVPCLSSYAKAMLVHLGPTARKSLLNAVTVQSTVH